MEDLGVCSLDFDPEVLDFKLWIDLIDVAGDVALLDLWEPAFRDSKFCKMESTMLDLVDLTEEAGDAALLDLLELIGEVFRLDLLDENASY